MPQVPYTPEDYADWYEETTADEQAERQNWASDDYYTRTCKLVINYFANGASGNPPAASSKVHSGTAEAVTLTDVVKDKGSSMTKSGFNFVGWSISSSSTTIAYNPGDKITKEWAANASGTQAYNLYAVWTESPIIIYKPGEDAIEYSDQYNTKYQEAPLNQAIQLKGATYTRTGYTQTGWKTASGSTTFTVGQTYTRTTNSNLTLYPIWTANVYTVTVKPNGATGSDVTYSVTYGTEFTIANDPFSRTGYHILSFNEAQDGSASDWYMGTTYLYTRTSNVTLYTIWAGNEYFVLYDDGTIDSDKLYVIGEIYTDLVLDENNNLYSETDDLHIDANNYLYMNYPGIMEYVINDELSKNYSIATYGSDFYTERRPITKDGYSFAGWKADDETILTKQDVWLDAYSFGSDPTWIKLENAIVTPIWSEEYPYGKIFFGRKESSDYGIVVEHPPTYKWAERDIEHKDVNGRNGDAISNQNRYKNVDRVYDIAAYNKNGYYDISTKVSGFLHRYYNPKYLRLEDSYEPDVYMLALYEESNELENLLDEAGRGKITFNCKPQKFLISGDRRIDIIETETNIHNSTAQPAAPIIKIRGTGIIRFSGKPDRMLYGLSAPTKTAKLEINKNFNTITIDCETFSVTDNLGNNASSLITLYDTIRLYPGANTIRFEGNIKHISIIPRWWRV